ncbi:hypothetical protein HGO97_003645 [Faecalicatena sp. AGMB00832]|uniref:MazG-like nucleotide pyrophosphohydrolase family protein n=2 Tax=Faecalicatena faecalis TaxID=2726362 RepID=A0ABS6D076_9FIRM|nr:hypothetical protein [Faecalicatena sp.]MBU3874906.1 hypothetical protein [Faecalicatena faecalis]MCI6465730.1 hypothetical protein [Faecalicatena sp.]MDY5617995.1 hypothetical protein [Lachnospiraceae bacterium]
MDTTEDIFKRATVKGVADYLLYGSLLDKDERNYKERMDDTYHKYERLIKQCDEKVQHNLLDLAGEIESVSASVHIEIGLQAGILLILDMFKNMTIEQESARSLRNREKRDVE